MITNVNELIEKVILTIDYYQRAGVELYSSFVDLQLVYMRIDEYEGYSYSIKREMVNYTCSYTFSIRHEKNNLFYSTVNRDDIIKYYNAKKDNNKEELFRFELIFCANNVFFFDFIEILYSKLKIDPVLGFQDSFGPTQYFFELYNKQCIKYLQSIK